MEYLVDVRDGNLATMGYVPAGSYGGMCLGRLLLAEPTHRFGEKRMLLLYATICLAMQLIFWLVPNIISSAISFSIMGFFFGPFFAAVRKKTPQSHLTGCQLSIISRVYQSRLDSFQKKFSRRLWVSTIPENL